MATAAAGSAVAQGVVWTHESEGSSWLAETVTIGGEGEHVFTEVGSYVNNRLLFSAHDSMPPEPVWSDDQLDYNFERVVDSASLGDVQVAMHQRQASPGSVERRAILRKFRSDSSAPDWVFEFPTPIYSHPYTDVRVSADGSRIVAAVLDNVTGRPRLWTFSPASSTPVSTKLVDHISSWVTFDLSEDGQTAVFSNAQRLVVVDLVGEQPPQQLSVLGMPNYGSVAVSDDGHRIAYGTAGKVLIFGRESGGVFTLLGQHLLGAHEYVSSLDLSGDGAALALGVNKLGDLSFAKIKKLNTSNLAVTFSYEVPAAGSLQNLVRETALSHDGEVLVAGLWGDGQGLTPELLVFWGDAQAPALAHHLPGSVNDMDLSPDGDRLAVASKPIHATIAGGGGAFTLFETRERDLNLTGVPSVGETVRFAHQTEFGMPTRLLYAGSLAAEPRVFGGAGTLYLSESSLGVVPGAVVADGNGVAKTSYSIPNNATLIGSTVYFQGLALRPRGLTEDYVKMTILP